MLTHQFNIISKHIYLLWRSIHIVHAFIVWKRSSLLSSTFWALGNNTF